MVSSVRPMSRSRRFLEALKRNLLPSEPEPWCYRGGTENPDSVPPGLDRAATVTLPRHQVVMLRRAAGELQQLARDNFDSFVATYGDEDGHVKHPEEAHTLSEIEREIASAQHAIDEFDRVYPNG